MKPDREWIGLTAWERLKARFSRAWSERRAGSAREQKRLQQFRLVLLAEAWRDAHPWTEKDRDRELQVARKYGICFVDGIEPDHLPAADDCKAGREDKGQ